MCYCWFCSLQRKEQAIYQKCICLRKDKDKDKHHMIQVDYKTEKVEIIYIIATDVIFIKL